MYTSDLNTRIVRKDGVSMFRVSIDCVRESLTPEQIETLMRNVVMALNSFEEQVNLSREIGKEITIDFANETITQD